MLKPALLTLALAASASADISVGVAPSNGAQWLGFMNVFELPEHGGGYVFGNGWGIADLNANFNDGAGTLTLSPNTIGDPSPFWYQGGGAPGHRGNKSMEANLYVETTDAYRDQLVTFHGSILADTFTPAHQMRVFIKDFAPDYGSVIESSVLITSAGDFSISLHTDAGFGRHVQYGFQVRGENVWFTDVAPFGHAVIATPAPGALALAGMASLFAARRRRDR